jgi:predicted XRE-type DNA-binding protein
MSRKKEEYHVTEGNIFADLGLEQSEELLARSKLLMRVADLIKKSKLTQKQIAEKLDITQPKVSMLVSGKLSAFSTDTLLHYLSLLGCDVEIRLTNPKNRSRSRRRGRIAVH